MTQSARRLHSVAMPRPFAALLLPISLVCFSAPSSALVIEFTALVKGLNDAANRLDGSVSIDTIVTGTYTVDPTPSGGAFGEVGAARLEFTVGSYTFDQTADPHRINLLDDTGPVIAPVDIWETSDFVAAQLDPAISLQANPLGFRAALQLFDFTGANITGTESEVFVADDLSDWSEGRLTLDSLIDDLGTVAIGDLQISADIQTWQVVPEPQAALLLAGGLVGIAAHRRRRARR